MGDHGGTTFPQRGIGVPKRRRPVKQSLRQKSKKSEPKSRVAKFHIRGTKKVGKKGRSVRPADQIPRDGALRQENLPRGGVPASIQGPGTRKTEGLKKLFTLKVENEVKRERERDGASRPGESALEVLTSKFHTVLLR